MKKSEQYRLAQMAVLQSSFISSSKLDIIRTLQRDEDLALLTEKREAEKAEPECEKE